MNTGAVVFAQVTKHLPLTTFRRCVARYGGSHKVKTFSCLDQYLCMAFAQLTPISLLSFEVSTKTIRMRKGRKALAP